MDSEMSGEEIAKLLHDEPERAFALLVEKYGGIVKTVCANTLSGFCREDIEEAVADSFIGLWRSRDRLAGAQSVKGYIIGIARNSAIDKLKAAKKVAPPVVIDADMTDEVAPPVVIDADMTDEVARRENIETVRRTIDNMPPFEREVFVRRYYLYERVKSISEHMGCGEKKVENILYRYKEKLKAELIKGGVNL